MLFLCPHFYKNKQNIAGLYTEWIWSSAIYLALQKHFNKNITLLIPNEEITCKQLKFHRIGNYSQILTEEVR